MKQLIGFGKTLVICGVLATAITVPAWAKDKKGDAPQMTFEGAKILVDQIKGTDGCTNPGDAPGPVPDGKTVAEQDLVTFINSFKAFDQSVSSYQECLRQAALADAENLSDDHKTAVAVVGNHYADEAINTGAALNEQIRAYKAAHPSN